MAYTITKVTTVFGNKNVDICEVSADAASGTIPTSLGSIDGWSIGPKSMATAAIKMAASGGTITISNAASCDNFYVTVYGRG
jgi:hypothetical protein